MGWLGARRRQRAGSLMIVQSERASVPHVPYDIAAAASQQLLGVVQMNGHFRGRLQRQSGSTWEQSSADQQQFGARLSLVSQTMVIARGPCWLVNVRSIQSFRKSG